MTCSACGWENVAGRKFCRECGAPLDIVCAACGAGNTPGDKFCGECGEALADAAAPSAPGAVRIPAAGMRAAAVAERRLVSVLFADLVGFTTLSESRDPEEVRELLGRYFDACSQLIARYGGSVEKFIGDAVMAVWGTPVAQEDDAERAVRAALELTAAVSTLGHEVGAPDLKARVGVLTGEAAVTIGAQGQGMVAGDLVNTASRVQSVAAPGAVLVDEATRRITEAAVVYEEAGEHELKGKSETVRLWRALRVIGGRGGALRSAGLEAPFVGRDRELRVIKEQFHASAEERKAHLLAVTGAAGIGKSRLSWEFYKYIDGLLEGIWWHRGRCLSYGEGVAYWALAEMVRGRADIVEGEEAGSALAKLRASVESFVPDAEERQWVEQRLAHLLGLEERTARDAEDLFSAWRLFFERMAEQGPVILVFEDMQWADASLLDFIEYLMNWSRNHALFVVTLARPEFAETRPDWGGGKRGVTALYLEPLTAEAIDDLLTGLVPGLPEELRTRIRDRAEGVPLYAMETVRMLLDRGLLAQEGASYRPTGPVEALEVPETLHALIAARLDGLTPRERSLIQDASVLGKTFTKPALSSLTGVPELELEPFLASLMRKEILQIQADPRSPERGQYGFLQDLVKRVAYETLSRRDRKARHLAAADFLERTWGPGEEEIVEVVASHFLEAYRAAPESPDAEIIKGRAREMLARAGRRAASLAATEEARRYFEQALELADEPATQADLRERAGQVAWMGGRIPEAREHLEEAALLLKAEGMSHPAARVSALLGEVLRQEGQLHEALALMERAFEVLAEEEPDEDLARLAAELGRQYLFTGESDRAKERIELALAVAEALRLPEVFAEALNTKSSILVTLGRPEEARVLVQHALEVAIENDLGAAALRAYNNLASLLDNLDRFAEEVDVCRQGLDLARKYGNRVWEWKFMANVLFAFVATGRWDDAADRMEEVARAEDMAGLQTIVIELLAAPFLHAQRGDFEAAERALAVAASAEASAEVQVRATFAVSRAAVLRGEGRYAEALASIAEALAVQAEVGTISAMFKDGFVEAMESTLALGDQAKAREVLAKAEAIPPGERMPSTDAHVVRFRARLAADEGSSEGVEAGFADAADRFRELRMPFWLAVSLLEHGEWLGSSGRGADAPPLLDEARAIFEDLRAAPWLARLERAVGASVEAPVASGS